MWEFLDSLLDRTEGLAQYVESTLRAGVEARLAKQMMGTIADSTLSLAATSAPVVDFVRRAVRDNLRQRAEHNLFNPSAATESVLLLLQVYDSIERQGKEMLRLANDPRLQSRLRISWRARMELREAPTAALEQMVGLASSLGMVTRETRLAWETIFPMHGLTALILNSADLESFTRMRELGVVQTDLPLPRCPCRSVAQQVRYLRWCLRTFGRQLVKRANEGRGRLARANLDYVAYAPDVVVGEIARLATALPKLIYECTEIGNLAIRPVGQPCDDDDPPPGDDSFPDNERRAMLPPSA